MKINNKKFLLALVCLLAVSCSESDSIPSPADPEKPEPGIDVVQLPIVVHIVHFGDETGAGPNLSTDRILRQIEILNEDFRKKEGTRGYNDHVDGADAKIEFVLAKLDPESNPTDGINRIDASAMQVENLGYNQNHYAQYAYWDPNRYINIWVTPLPEDTECIALGMASGPLTNLPGTALLSIPGDGDADGILINWIHFGESEIDCHVKYGRTLTHEMGHFLGLLHTWGGKDCEHNDYCDDTPAVADAVYGRTPYAGCDGETIMIGNYMNYSDDDVMNIFTNDQVERMYYVLNNHTGRNSLMTSPALK
ncbi:MULTISPECIES: M43 family zinc metalloprotease [Flavobacteriaceae]|uniref:M43 family zinc metalloprotease n=1 Tax=Flavobacteriaceae TaxID=49546 RepID=UPI0023491523|nr:M43 family zinc metalloprotease [Muricauda sp. SP22]MDC6363632.1 M43 family zinc metalloprotease [Muricauda sp. SP22]